jgi:excisionase family DNA binding protein
MPVLAPAGPARRDDHYRPDHLACAEADPGDVAVRLVDRSQPELLTLEEVAKVCRLKSTKTVRRWVAAGHLPAIQLGRFWRVHPEDLAKFLRHRRR